LHIAICLQFIKVITNTGVATIIRPTAAVAARSDVLTNKMFCKYKENLKREAVVISAGL